MPGINQINYLKLNVELIKEPIAIIGSKEYSFDSKNYIQELKNMGFEEIFGVDIVEGKGVDIVSNICDYESHFVSKYTDYFNTVICMQTLYSVKNPFNATKSIQTIMNEDAILIFSDIFSHRINRIPKDYWRFTYDAHQILFQNLTFFNEKVRIGMSRKDKLYPLEYPFPEIHRYIRYKDESWTEFLFRRLYMKIFSTGFLGVYRLLPEISIFSIGKKIE